MKIKWGILGAGWIADKFIADFKIVENGAVNAIGARSLEKAKKLAKRYNVPKAYGNYTDLVNDPEIDIIYIATTHNFHFEHTKMCLEKGKHVLCEKPATVNAHEFEFLQQLANKNNLFFMEAMWTAYLPAVLKTNEWINSGKIGTVEVIQANFGFPAAPEFKERLLSPHLAGGALLDIGIYPLTIIEMFANSEIEKIDINSTMTETGVDATLSIQIKYENGIFAQMASSIKNQLMNDAFICGSKGFIQIRNFWMSKESILTNGDSTEIFTDSSTGMGYNFEIDAVNQDLIAGNIENKIMPLNRTKKMMQLMDSIRAKIGLKYPFE